MCVGTDVRLSADPAASFVENGRLLGTRAARAVCSNSARLFVVFGLILLALNITAPSASAQAGTITGTVVDASNGQPLPFANVVLIGTDFGAPTDDRGNFTIRRVPPGSYTVRVAFMGYELAEQNAVEVAPEGEATLNFTLKPKVVAEFEATVSADREDLIDTKSTSVATSVGGDDLESLPVDEITDAIALKAGVTAKGGELHFRGGRAGEVSVMVDGVAVNNPLTGGGIDLAGFAVEDAEVILGGLDAKYGNAQSGVINYTTREGGDHVAGTFRYQTDDFGAPDKTFNNYDRVSFGIGGPLPVSNMNYYASAQGTWTDAYPATTERRSHSRILDFISVGDRKVNDVRLQGKVSWKPGVPYKLNFELINNRTKSDRYLHDWSWEGYVQSFLDTLQTGEVLRRFGPWSPFKIDDTYEYYNAAEHTPNDDNAFTQARLAFTHTLGEGNTFYTVRLSRNAFNNRSAVQNKNPWEYEGEDRRDLYFDHLNSEQSLYFVRHGDYPAWSNRETRVYVGKSDMTHRWRNHTFETGLEFKYNDLLLHSIQQQYVNRDAGREIGVFDRYHVYHPEGSVYIQDRWEHEGMVLNMGLRYDLLSVGDQLDPTEVTQRVKRQLSPRIGIAYPISDRDVFSFHYGRYYQFPNRNFLFDNRTVNDNRTRGNPNLGNEQTVSYQAAIQHLFSETVKGQFSVYFKDIFGLLAIDQVRSQSSADLVPQYVNRDYASSRGFEVSLQRAFANGFTGELSYTFGNASGVASDADAATEQSFRYLPISEQPLDWDQRHSFSASFNVRDPSGNWTLGTVWRIGSGFPYTPVERDTRDTEPEVVNSRRLPADSSLDLQAERNYKVWGQPFKVFLQATNVLDTRNISNLEYRPFPGAPGLDAQSYTIYYTETGKAGGAYLGEDVTGNGSEDWVPLNDPRVFQEGRNVRIGVSLAF